MAIKFSFKLTQNDLPGLKKRLEDLTRAIDKNTAKKVGRAVIADMKDLIAKGISPIRGEGRFPGYKNTKKYPAGKKPNRPVNLKLTGDFLKSLDSEVKSSRTGYDTDVGFFDSDSKDKEEGHREGANGQLKRPIIPTKSEELAVTIQETISDIYTERILELIDKENE